MGRHKILVVDDAEAIIMCLSILIKRLGFEALQASNGTDAIRIARAEMPTMIILDIRMPDMDGAAVLKALKADSTTAGIPVVMYSVEGDSKRAECEALGCSDYLMKPATLKEVNGIIQKYCATSPQKRRESLRTSFNKTVQVTYQESVATLFAQNISEGGIYLSTLSPLPTGSAVKLAIPLEGDRTVHVDGVVIYTIDTGTEASGLEPGMAVRYNNLAADDEELISQEVKTLLAGDLIASQKQAVILETKVAARTRELQEANQRLRDLDTIKDIFIASMSHELRSPLTAVIGFTGLLINGSSGPVTEEQAKHLELVKQNSEQVLALINDIIDVSMIGAGSMKLSIEAFNAVDLLGEIADSFQPEFDKQGLPIDIDCSTNPTAESDRRRVRQIIVNLVSNALKYSDGGRVVLMATCSEEAVTVAVRDSGPGIAPEDHEKLFQPFSRLKVPKGTQKPGTGLGLFVSQKIAGLLGGSISVASTPGEGSTFTLTLPRKATIAQDEAAPKDRA